MFSYSLQHLCEEINAFATESVVYHMIFVTSCINFIDDYSAKDIT